MKQEKLFSVGAWIKQHGRVSKEELVSFMLAQHLVNPKDPSLAIRQLLEKEQCYEIKDGTYVPMGNRIRFKSSEVDPALAAVLHHLHLPVCLCPVSGFELNRFLSLQAFSPRLIVYAPKIVHDALCALLSRNGYHPVILRKKTMTYVNDKTIFVSGLNWRTPIDRKGQKLKTADTVPLICGTTLEKLLVDALAGDFPLDGAMLEELFYNALSHYAFNASTLQRYAKDRNRQAELEMMIRKCGFEGDFYD